MKHGTSKLGASGDSDVLSRLPDVGSRANETVGSQRAAGFWKLIGLPLSHTHSRKKRQYVDERTEHTSAHLQKIALRHCNSW